jgi:hypothetical protein
MTAVPTLNDVDLLEIMEWVDGEISFSEATPAQWLAHTRARRRNGQLARFMGRWNENGTLAAGSNVSDLCADCGEWFVMDIVTEENAYRAPLCKDCRDLREAHGINLQEGN